MKKIKNVDVMQCVIILIFSIVAICTILIPFKFSGADFALYHLPITGNGELVLFQADYVCAIFQMAGITAPKFLLTISNISLYVFYAILIFDFLASLLLICWRNNVVRIICKIISIIAGVAMIAICLLYFFYIIGFIANIASNLTAELNTLLLIQEGGLLFIFAIFIISFLLISRQFKWFRRYY